MTKIGVCLIAKNEGRYLLEWMAYALVIGFDEVLIYDNESVDDSRQIIKCASKVDQRIRYFPWPDLPGRPPQRHAYNDALKNTDADWIAFIDADEFIVLREHDTIGDFVAEFADSTGAVCLNWRTFGSSGHKSYANDLVIRRFTRCAEGYHSRFKSIVRRAAATQMFIHTARLSTGNYVAADGEIVNIDNNIELQTSKPRAFINHYILKSAEEYEHKVMRGQGGKASDSPDKRAKFTPNFWNRNDRNEAEDTTIAKFIPAVEAEMERLGAEGKHSGVGTKERKPSRGHVDRVVVQGAKVTVTGWAMDCDGNPADTISVRIGQEELKNLQPKRIRRPNIGRVISGADPNCGFSVAFSLFDLSHDALRETSIAVGVGDTGSYVRFSPEKLWPPRLERLVSEPPTIPRRPAMPPGVVEKVAAAMRESRCYLEYGTGGSTILAASTHIPSIICVESDLAWLLAVRRKVLDCQSLSGIDFIHGDIGETKHWGHPTSNDGFAAWHRYSVGAWEHCRERGLDPDLVLIDGRFRVACLLATLLFARPGCRVFFDDYAERPRYHSVEKFVRPLRNIGRTALFEVPRETDRDAVWLEMLSAVCRPA